MQDRRYWWRSLERCNLYRARQRSWKWNTCLTSVRCLARSLLFSIFHKFCNTCDEKVDKPEVALRSVNVFSRGSTSGTRDWAYFAFHSPSLNLRIRKIEKKTTCSNDRHTTAYSYRLKIKLRVQRGQTMRPWRCVVLRRSSMGMLAM